MWFPDDPQQTPWHRVLDEVATAGYTRIELGQYGHLPTDAATLAAERAAGGDNVELIEPHPDQIGYLRSCATLC